MERVVQQPYREIPGRDKLHHGWVIHILKLFLRLAPTGFLDPFHGPAVEIPYISRAPNGGPRNSPMILFLSTGCRDREVMPAMRGILPGDIMLFLVPRRLTQVCLTLTGSSSRWDAGRLDKFGVLNTAGQGP